MGVLRSFLIALALGGCSHQSGAHGDGSVTGDGQVMADAMADATPDAASCADLSPVATDLACPASCLALTCDCGGGVMRTFTAPCGTTGCIEGLRCATVCSLDASMCALTPAVWPTATGGVLTSTTGAQLYGLRFVTGGDLVGIGWFAKDVTVGGATLTATTSGNGFVFRIGRDGTSRWVHPLGTGTFPGDVRIASNGDIVIGLWLGRNVAADLGNSVTIASNPDEQLVLLRYSAAGIAQSAVQLGHGYGVTQNMMLALASDDSAAVIDNSSGDFVYGSQTLSGTFKSSPVVIATDAGGAVRWAKIYTSDQGAVPSAIAVTSSGDVVVSVLAFSAVDFGNGPLSGGVLARLAADGSLRFATAGPQSGALAAVGDDAITVSAGTPTFIARIDPTGGMTWQTDLHATLGGSLFANLTVDSHGAPVFAMRAFQAQIDGHDFFAAGGVTLLVQLDASGHYVRGRGFGGKDNGVYRTAMDIAADGTVAFGGFFDDPAATVDFGAGQWTAPPQPTPSTYVSEGYFVTMQP